MATHLGQRNGRRAHGGSKQAMRWGPVVVLLLALCACSGGGAKRPTVVGVAAQEPYASGAAGSVFVREAWIPGPPGRNYPPGSHFVIGLKLTNKGSSWDRLTSVTTPASSQVTVSQYNIEQDFISLTTDPSRVSCAAQASDATRTIVPGERVPVTLHFSSAGSLTLQVPVRARVF